MKNSVFFVISVASLVLFLAACAPAATEAPIPPVILDTTGPSTPSPIKASAVVVPARVSHLSFVISGPLREVTVQAGDRVEAGQVLATLSAPNLEFGVTQAEAALRAAEFDYAYWIPPRLNRPPERRQLAQQQLEQVRRALDTAHAQLTQARLTAPFAGSVTSVDARVGEFLPSGQTLLTIASLQDLQIETTDLGELNVTAVKIGQPAQVFVEALDASFPGKVSAISPISNSLGGDVVFKVTLKFDQQPSGLLWGMSAVVEIRPE